MGKNSNKRNNKQSELTKDFDISDAIFFPEDFKKIPPNCIILVEKGTILLPVRKK